MSVVTSTLLPPHPGVSPALHRSQNYNPQNPCDPVSPPWIPPGEALVEEVGEKELAAVSGHTPCIARSSAIGIWGNGLHLLKVLSPHPLANTHTMWSTELLSRLPEASGALESQVSCQWGSRPAAQGCRLRWWAGAFLTFLPSHLAKTVQASNSLKAASFYWST